MNEHTAPDDPVKAAAAPIAVLPGDGIGPDVVAGAIRVLDTVAALDGFEVQYEHILVGGAAIDAYGVPLRQEDLIRCRQAQAIILGAVGGPKWDHLAVNSRPERALLRLRSELNLGINLRPVQAIPTSLGRSPLKADVARNADIAFIRELTGGVYFGQPSYYHRTLNGKYAVDTAEYTERQVLPILEFAFDLARTRGGKVTSVDKANVMNTSRLWREVATEYGQRHPDIELDHALVDSFAMALIQDPTRYDVVVTENLFGDILTDLAGVIAGTLGILPSASLQPTIQSRSIGTGSSGSGLRPRRFGMYEPIHGSAPNLAGHDIANPVGCILSIALLLEWSLGRPDAARSVRDAVRAVMDDGVLTADLVEPEHPAADLPVGTVAFTDAVVARLQDAGGSRGRSTLRHDVA